MFRNPYPWLAVILFIVFTASASAGSPAFERGRMLYENHCLACHESTVHIRANNKAHSQPEVLFQVARWAGDLQLGWQGDEIGDVSHYLYRRFYLKKISSGGNKMGMTISSSAFPHNESIPEKFSCDGSDISPPLSWSGLPAGTKSLVLIVDDPDAPDPAAPRMTWVHWLLYNLPPDAVELEEAVAATALPGGTLQGLNDWKRTGFGGPCPPIGRHRYFHKLYALNTLLPDLGNPDKAQLEQAMAGHILDQAELIGTFQRR
jgi:Raf kinase inhibitor-like YbhB/YbcL family protein